MDDIENLLDDALEEFAVGEQKEVAPHQKNTDACTSEHREEIKNKEIEGSLTGKGLLETSTDDPLGRPTATAEEEHMGCDHRGARHRSSAEATTSTKLKFDPLGARKGKRDPDTGMTSAMEQELNMLMKELLGDSQDAQDDTLGGDRAPSMKETLDALKASGLGGHEGGNGMGCVEEEESISSALVDGIMRQLLSKDILYQPMKEIGERYPPWLEENKDSLDFDEFAQYTKQYRYIQKICEIYESEPDNFNGLMTLLQEMQECGQPPQAIIDELSPEDASSFASSLTNGSPSSGGQCVII